MSKRLQVVLDDREMEEIARLARARKMTISEWVRSAIRGAKNRSSGIAGDKKLKIIRSAVQHSFPTADIDRMLGEIEAGYSGGLPE